MKRVLKLAEEGTGGGTISNSTIGLVVQDYWRKLGYPGALRGDERRPRNVVDSKVRTRERRRRNSVKLASHTAVLGREKLWAATD